MTDLPNLTIDDAATLLGVSTKTLRRWETQGRISPSRTPGGQRRYSMDSLKAIHNFQTPISNLQINSQTSNFHLQELAKPLIAPIQKKILGCILAIAILATGSVVAVKNTNLLSRFTSPLIPLLSLGEVSTTGSVLAAESINDDYRFVVNIPALFNKDLTAPNVIYGLNAGDNITVTAGQTPTISATDQTTDLKIFGNVKVGSNTISAGSKTDTLELAAGDNITLSTDTSNKKVTIKASVTDVTTSGWTDDGTILRLTTAGDIVSIGTATGAAKLSLDGNTNRDVFTASQSGNLLAKLTSTGLFNLTATGFTAGLRLQNGATFFSGVGAPSDADGANGDYYFRTDATAGNTSSYVKIAGTWTATGGAATTLQDAYGNGNTLTTTDARDIDFTLANTATDANFTIDIATGSTGSFQVQSNGTPVTTLSTAGITTTGTLTLSALTDGVLYTSSDVVTSAGIGSDGQVLTASGGVPVWAGGSGSGTIGWWQRNLGVLSPSNITDDLTVGGTATSSAKFQVFGLTGSATSAGNLTFSSAATIATTAKQSLTLGDSNTGNIIMSGGNVGIGTTGPLSKLDVQGAVTGKALVSFNETGDQNIFTASQSGIPVFNLARIAGTAANGITLTPSTTGNGPTLAATGSDTNIAYSIDAKGTGALNLNNTGTGDVLIAGGSGSTGCTITNSTGALVCAGAVSGSNLSGTNTGDITLAAIGSTPNANGMTLTGQALNLQPADGTYGGIVSTTTQTFAGTKTLTSPSITTSLTTGSTSFDLLNTTATTVNFAGVATTLNIGAATGTTTINNSASISGVLSLASTLGTQAMTTLTIGNATTGNIVLAPGGITALTAIGNDVTIVDGLTAGGDIAVNGGDITSSATSFNLLQSGVTTLNIGGAATTLSIGAATGTTTINNASLVATGDLAVNGGDITSSQTTFNFVTGATTLNIGATTGTTTINNDLTIGNAITDAMTFTGRVATDSDLIPIGTTGTNDLGSTSSPWDNLYVTNVYPNGTSGTIGWWQRNEGVLSPLNITDDLVIGAIATASAKFQIFADTGNATTAGNLTFDSAGTIQTTKNQTLTLGGSTTGNINLPGLTASKIVFTDANKNLTSTGTAAAIQGGTGFASYAVGDLLYADATTTLAKRVVGGTGQVLIVSGGVPTWGSISGSSGCTDCVLTDPSATQTIVPTGTSTTGLRIAQVSGGTVDVFSVTNFGSTSKYLAIQSDGTATAAGSLTLFSTPTIATTAMKSLTLGDSNTGNIQIGSTNTLVTPAFKLTTSPGSGYALISDANGVGSWTDVTTTGNLGPWTLSGSSLFPDSAAYNLLVGSASTADDIGKFTVSGTKTGKALAVFNDTGTDQNLLTASASGVTKFTVDHNGLISTASVDSTSIVNGSIANADLANSSVTINSSGILTGGGAVSLGGTLTLTATEADTLASVTGRGATTSTLTTFTGGLTSSGVVTGKALNIFNETGDQNILTASKSGTPVFVVNGGTNDSYFDLTSSGDFTIKDAGSIFATFTDAGVFTLDSLNFDGTTIGLTTDTDLLSLAANSLTINGDITSTGDIAVNGGDLTSTATTFNLLNATVTTLNLGGAATIISLGAGTGTTTVNNALTATGAFTANGTLTFTGKVAQDSDLVPITTTGTNDLGASSLPWDNLYVNNIVTDSTATGQSGYFTRSAGVLSPAFTNDVLAATTSATVALTLTQTGAFNALLVEDSASDTTPFVIDQSGNVGIGTTGPGKTLEVSHASANQLVRVTRGATSFDIGVNSAGTDYGLGIWYSDGTALAKFRQNAGFAVGSTYANADPPAGGAIIEGNVGIGTTGPGAKLESLSTSEQLRLSYDASTNFKFTVGSGGSLTVDQTVASAGSIRFKVSGANNAAAETLTLLGQSGGRGFVGINKASPSYVLDVTDPYAESGIRLGSVTLIEPVVPTSNSVVDVLKLKNGVGGTGSGVGAGLLFQALNSNANLKNIAEISGLFTTTTQGSELAALTFNLANTGTSSLVEAMRITTTGNVGIGTTSPTALLDIAGATGASTSGILSFRGTTDPKINILNGEAFGIQTSVGGDAGLGEKFTITNLGNVGIGTTGPNSKLAVVGNVEVDSNANKFIARYTSGSDNYHGSLSWYGLQLGNNGENYIVGGRTGTGGTLNFVVNNTNDISGTTFTPNGTIAMKILSTGNVGIGTTGPRTKLDVIGNAPIFDVTGADTTLHHLVVSEGTPIDWRPYSGLTTAALQIQSSATQGVLIVPEMGSGSVGTKIVSAGGDLRLYSNATLGTNLGTLGIAINAGNVGIGTTGPAALLHLSASSPEIRLTTAGAGLLSFYDNTTLKHNVGLTSDNRLQFRYSSTDLVTIQSNGNVGIGTTAPVGKLEVSGAVVGKALGIFNETGDQNILVASASGTNRFVITNAGNVGIGTTAPDAALEINHATGDSLRLTYNDANGSAGNYTDFSLSATGELTLTGSAATLGASATAEKTFLTLTPGVITLTAPTQVTSLMETAVLTGATIAADAATTVNKATTLSLVAPIDSTNVTLTDASALRILNVTSGTGTLTNQYGIYVDSLTAGATANYGLYVAGGDIATLDNLWVGATAETIANVSFASDGNDAFVSGMLGVEGDIYTDGDVDVAGGDVTTANTTATLFNTTATTLSMGGAATTLLDIGNGSGNYTAINLGSGAGTHVINIAGTGATAADTINIGTGGTGADTINLGSSASTTALNFTSGTGAQTFASSMATGNAFAFTANSLSTGLGLYLSSTSTALSSGSLASLDWSPGSATTATGDLLKLNIGANGLIGNIFNVLDNASSVFSVSQTAITAGLPASFTAPGDVSLAYDLLLTNQTSSYLKSNGPLYLNAGETWESNDLTFQTYNAGNIIANTQALAINGAATISGNLLVSDSQTATSSAFIANTNTAAGIVGLGIKLSSTTLDTTSRFINFLDKSGIVIGKINAANTTTVAYSANGTDMAEYFVKNDETFSPGDVVSASNSDLTKTSLPYDSKMIGIVSTAPSFVGGQDGSNKVLVAIVGQVPVKIATSSAAIAKGDFVTSSIVAGRVTKAVKPGFVIGKALEDWQPGGADQILVYINNTWADPNNSLAFDENGNLAVNGTVTAKDIIASPSPSPSPYQEEGLLGEVSSLRESIASISAELTQLKLTSPPSPLLSLGEGAGGEVWIYATASGKLTSIFNVQVPELTVTGKLAVGLLSFDDLEASISSLTGIITVKGDLAVSGSIKVLGTSAGKSVIPAGNLDISIDNPLASTTSAIFVTPEDPVAISGQSTQSGQFTIRIPQALSTDLKFQWWIVN